MPALANTTRAIARSWTAHQLPVARAGCTALQTRNASASSFDSPFKGAQDSTKIPSFAAYRNKGGETGPKVFQYFMVGTMGALSALGAKATVQGRSPPRLRVCDELDCVKIGRNGFKEAVGEQLAILGMIPG
jgi:ubiquinol-cytochrome c reductase iron-sulfur subunit